MISTENKLKAKRPLAARLQFIVVVLAGVIFGYLFFVLPGETEAKGSSAAEDPIIISPENETVPADPQDIDFSRFGRPAR